MSEKLKVLKQQISIAAYYLAQKNHPYDTLCWWLAERELFILNNFRRVSKERIRQKAAEIYVSNPSYDVLCWLIAEKEVILKSKKFKPGSKPYFFK